MSYVVHPYLLKIDELKKVIGSNDQRFFDRLPKSLKKTPKKRERIINAPATQALLAGKLKQKDILIEDYIWALKIFCGIIGTWEAVESLESIRSCCGPFAENEWGWMLHSGPPVKIKYDHEIFYNVGHMYNRNIKKELERTIALKWSRKLQADDIEFREEVRRELIEFYKKAMESKMDIVTFYS